MSFKSRLAKQIFALVMKQVSISPTWPTMNAPLIKTTRRPEQLKKSEEPGPPLVIVFSAESESEKRIENGHPIALLIDPVLWSPWVWSIMSPLTGSHGGKRDNSRRPQRLSSPSEVKNIVGHVLALSIYISFFICLHSIIDDHGGALITEPKLGNSSNLPEVQSYLRENNKK